jgi:hypothetical protein
LEVIFWTLFIWLNWFWQCFSFPLATEPSVCHVCLHEAEDTMTNVR